MQKIKSRVGLSSLPGSFRRRGVPTIRRCPRSFEPLESRFMLTVIAESELNNSFGSAQSLVGSQPYEVRGAISTAADLDFFAFDATAGNPIAVGLVPKQAALQSAPGLGGEMTAVGQVVANSSNCGGSYADSGTVRDDKTFPSFDTQSALIDITAESGVAHATGRAEAHYTSSTTAGMATVEAFADASVSSSNPQCWASSFPYGMIGHIHFALRVDNVATVRLQYSIHTLPSDPGGRTSAQAHNIYQPADDFVPWLPYSVSGVTFLHLLEGTGISPTISAGAIAVAQGPSTPTSSATASVSVEWELVPFIPQMALFDPQGAIVSSGSDSINYVAEQSGTYRLGVTEGADLDFDGNGGAGEGDATADYTLTVRLGPPPDIESQAGNWNATQGGIDFTYSISDGPLPQPAIIEYLWAYGNRPEYLVGQAAPAALSETADGGHSLSVPGGAFAPPPPETTHLIIFADQGNAIEESDEFNNYVAVALQLAPPSVELVVAPETPLKHTDYHVSVNVTNPNPVPVIYTLDWHETFLSPIDLKDGRGGGDEGRSGNDVSLGAIGSHQSRSLDLGAFNRTWVWFDVASADAAFSALAAIRDLFIGAYSDVKQALEQGKLLQRLQQVKTALDFTFDLIQPNREATINYSAQVEDILGHGSGDSALTTLRVSEIHDSKYSAFVTYKTLFSMSFGALISSAHAANPIAFLGALNAAVISYDQARKALFAALDPPDPNFQEVVRFQPLSFAEVDAMPSGFWKDFARTSITLGSLSAAENLARDRADGAAEGGNDYWRSLQLIDSAGLAHRAALLETRLVAQQLVQAGYVNGTPWPSSAEIAQLLQDNDLSQAMAEPLTRLGWTQEQIDALSQSIAALQPDDFANNSLEAVTAVRIASLTRMHSAMENLREAISIRVNELELPTRDLSPAERQNLDTMQSDVSSALSTATPSSGLLRDIEWFTTEVRGMALDTNNYPAIADDLEFAYTALLDFQLLDASPAGLAQSIDDLAVAGQIPDAAFGDLLRIRVSSAQAFIGSDNFGAAAGALQEFVAAIDGASAESITPTAAHALSHFGAYLVDVVSGSSDAVDRADVADFIRYYGRAGSGIAVDFNDDHVVDLLDLGVLARRLSTPPSAPSAPAAVVVVAQRDALHPAVVIADAGTEAAQYQGGTRRMLAARRVRAALAAIDDGAVVRRRLGAVDEALTSDSSMSRPLAATRSGGLRRR